VLHFCRHLKRPVAQYLFQGACRSPTPRMTHLRHCLLSGDYRRMWVNNVFNRGLRSLDLTAKIEVMFVLRKLSDRLTNKARLVLPRTINSSNIFHLIPMFARRFIFGWGDLSLPNFPVNLAVFVNNLPSPRWLKILRNTLSTILLSHLLIPPTSLIRHFFQPSPKWSHCPITKILL
jgi:hypothetical protein